MGTHLSLTFGDLLRRHRLAAGLTQEELAGQANLSVRAISDLERGVKHAPHRSTVRLLAKALELSNEDLATLEGAVGRRRGPGSSSDKDIQSLSLPLPPTPFVGRQREVEEVVSLLAREDVRLLTLTGPGGIGKTRLALEAVREVQDAYADGVHLVLLAGVADPGVLPAAIATALGVTEATGQPILERLEEHLQERRLLLVLDNFEHLLEAAEALSQLLASCPELTILVASRAVLHLAAEHEYPVPPLRTPVPGHLPDPDALALYDSVQLFMQRASAIKPNFQLSEDNAAPIAEVCFRLDGLPLAIELAAARLRLFPPHALLKRLEGGLGLLSGGAKDLPDRQQTLESTIDWSYSLLSSREQALFERLSVFVGGCAIEAAESVCNPEGELNLLDGLASLVEKSMVEQSGEEEPRFTMLQTIREYAARKLQERGEADAVRGAHASWFLELAESAEPELRGAEQRTWLRLLDGEHANLLGALHWTRENGEVVAGLRLATALWRFWSTRGQYSEARTWLDTLLELEGCMGHPAPPLLRAKALNQLARYADRQGDLDRAVMLGRESLALNRAAGDKAGIASSLSTLAGALKQQGEYTEAMVCLEECLALRRHPEGTRVDETKVASTLNSLGGAARWQGYYDRAESLFQEALDLYTKQNDIAGVAHMLFRLGDARLDRCDFSGARQLYQESLVMRRDLADVEGTGFVLNGLALVAHLEGEYEEAARLAEESLALFREVGARRQISCMLDTLARIEVDREKVERAATLYRESLALALASGAKELVPYGLEGLGRIAALRDDPDRGARLYGAGWALRDTLNTPPAGHERAAYDRAIGEIRPALGEDAFNAAWKAGRAMSMEQAAAYALDQLPAGVTDENLHGEIDTGRAVGIEVRQATAGP